MIRTDKPADELTEEQQGSLALEAPRHSSLHRVIEAPVLFPVITLLLLAAIWGTTLNLISSERRTVDRVATSLVSDLADTYEAQVVRALREIDQTLKLVHYNLNSASPREVLEILGQNDLLPPELIFTVSIVDGDGNILATNNSSVDASVTDTDFLQRTIASQDMVVSLPAYDEGIGDWQLNFSHSVGNGEDGYPEVIVVSVDAGYFVSGYEADLLGEQGVLALVGTDGVFRVRRTGDAVNAGEQVEYGALVPEDDFGDAVVTIQVNDWDDTRRYTIARQLFEFPLAIVVGVSEEEQLAPVEQLSGVFMMRASAASLVVIAVIAVLGRLSWQLQKARERVAEERVAHAKRVEYLAYHDGLTDLPNRVYFSRLLTKWIQRARRYGSGVALLFLDLDRFKAVNDSLGHDAGDELLQEVSRRLQASVRQSDIVARLGGDEFVVLLPEIRDGKTAVPVADNILTAVSKPFLLAEQNIRITVSVGISIYPADGEDEQTLMKNADVAMYHAKEQGKNNYQFYSKELSVDSLERLALESSLRNALERNEFRLFYQAKRDMVSGSICGVEALLRWQHPDLGMVQPMQFIPLAEETGLIVPIGLWVLRTACEQNVAWQKAGMPPLSMAVNLSARQFYSDELFDDITGILHETGMDPHLLELEITESMLMRNMEQTIRILKALKQMGIRIAIDDFGTGYSSLSMLKEFPLDSIKIDGSFIHDVGRSDENRSLTKAIISVGKSLGLTVVAEGVETMDQADFLSSEKCNEFQGFYINKPMAADEFSDLLRS